jgi:hypothetical protein
MIDKDQVSSLTAFAPKLPVLSVLGEMAQA